MGSDPLNSVGDTTATQRLFRKIDEMKSINLAAKGYWIGMTVIVMDLGCHVGGGFGNVR